MNSTEMPGMKIKKKNNLKKNELSTNKQLLISKCLHQRMNKRQTLTRSLLSNFNILNWYLA